MQEALKITFLKQSNVEGVIIAPEWSDDLIKWTADNRQGGPEIVCVMQQINDRKYKMIYYIVDAKSTPQVFLRLKASLR